MLREAGVAVDGRIYYEDFLKIMAGQIGQQQKKVSPVLSRSAIMRFTSAIATIV